MVPSIWNVIPLSTTDFLGLYSNVSLSLLYYKKMLLSSVLVDFLPFSPYSTFYFSIAPSDVLYVYLFIDGLLLFNYKFHKDSGFVFLSPLSSIPST